MYLNKIYIIPFVIIFACIAYKVYTPLPLFINELVKEKLILFFMYFSVYIVGNINFLIGSLYGICVFCIDRQVKLFSDQKVNGLGDENK